MKDPFQNLSHLRPIAAPADLYPKIMNKVAQQEANRLPAHYVRIAAIILLFLWGATIGVLLQPIAVTATTTNSDTSNLYPTNNLYYE